MWKYAVLIAYSGTHYCGWQKQKGSGASGDPSLQESIEKALGVITGESVSVVGSGRTDSGVHAAGQVAHFILRQKAWDAHRLMKGLNSQLSQDIRILALSPVSLEFHAQKSAEKKQYSYYYQQGSCAPPHLLPYTRWIRKDLDLDAVTQALGFLRGEHDFKAFQASGSKPGSTVRTVLEADVTVLPILFPALGFHEGGSGLSSSFRLVRIRLVGTGFLKQMVRSIAGTLLQVGEGYRPPSCIREVLASKDRSQVGPTAPARGLWLEKVWYPSEFGLRLEPWREPEEERASRSIFS
ncbi:MAG: tRNA pseudouridine(38-40) synthase TruA [Bdellovibrionia bacterium]